MSVRNQTISIGVTLVTETCYSCGVLFAMPDDLRAELLKAKAGRSFYCPNGHAQHYIGKTDAQLRREAEQRAANAEEDARIARVEATTAKRAATKAKNELAKTKRRAAAAVCPCCHRSFVQLRRHMQAKHPEHLAEQGIKS